MELRQVLQFSVDWEAACVSWVYTGQKAKMLLRKKKKKTKKKKDNNNNNT